MRFIQVPLKTVLAWILLYLIVLAGLSATFGTLTLIRDTFHIKLLEDLHLIQLLISFALVGIGVATLLPFSQHTYTRRAGINPAIARDAVQHRGQERGKQGLGILLGVVGFTSAVELNPWQSLFSVASSSLGVPVATLMTVAILILLVVLYRRKLRLTR